MVVDELVTFGLEKAKIARDIGDAVAKRVLDVDFFQAGINGELCAIVRVEFVPPQQVL